MLLPRRRQFFCFFGVFYGLLPWPDDNFLLILMVNSEVEGLALVKMASEVCMHQAEYRTAGLFMSVCSMSLGNTNVTALAE